MGVLASPPQVYGALEADKNCKTVHGPLSGLGCMCGPHISSLAPAPSALYFMYGQKLMHNRSVKTTVPTLFVWCPKYILPIKVL